MIGRDSLLPGRLTQTRAYDKTNTKEYCSYDQPVIELQRDDLGTAGDKSKNHTCES